MSYRCETHYSDEESGSHKGKVAIAVCHHCGKPICQSIKLPLIRSRYDSLKELCGYLIDDPCFFSPAGQPKVDAYHCESCLIKYHEEFSVHLQKAKSSI